MEEMRQLINRRSVDSPGGRYLPPLSPINTNGPSAFDISRLERWTNAIEDLVEEADRQIAQAIDQNEALCKDMSSLAIDPEVRRSLSLLSFIFLNRTLVPSQRQRWRHRQSARRTIRQQETNRSS
jgi:hypothetical protein